MDEIKPSLEQILESVGEVGDSIKSEIKEIYDYGKDIPYYLEIFSYYLNKKKEGDLFITLWDLNSEKKSKIISNTSENENYLFSLLKKYDNSKKEQILSAVYYILDDHFLFNLKQYLNLFEEQEINDETLYILNIFEYKQGKYTKKVLNKFLKHRKKLGKYSKYFDKIFAHQIENKMSGEELLKLYLKPKKIFPFKDIEELIEYSNKIFNYSKRFEEPYREFGYKIKLLSYDDSDFIKNKEIFNEIEIGINNLAKKEEYKFLKNKIILDSIYQYLAFNTSWYNKESEFTKKIRKLVLKNPPDINSLFVTEDDYIKRKKPEIIPVIKDFEKLINEIGYEERNYRQKLIKNRPELFFRKNEDYKISYDTASHIGDYLLVYEEKYKCKLEIIKLLNKNNYNSILDKLFTDKEKVKSDINAILEIMSKAIKNEKDSLYFFNALIEQNSDYLHNAKNLLGKNLSKEEIAEIPLYDLKGEILRKIGEGTRSKVYTLKNENEDTILAMKVPKDNKAEKKYKQEQKILDIFRRYPHENIVKFYYAGDDYVKIKDKPIYVIIQEYLEGKTIKDMLETYFIGLPNEQAKDVSMQLLGTINHLKEHNVFHMDLHLDNIIYNENKIKIFDFERATDKFGEMPNFNRRTGGDSDYFSWGIMVPQIFSNKHPIYEKKPGQSSNSFADIVYKLKKEIRDEEGKLKQKYKDRIKKLVPEEFYKPVVASLEYNGIGEVPKEITDFYNKKTYEKEKDKLKEILGIEVSYEQYKKLKELK